MSTEKTCTECVNGWISVDTDAGSVAVRCKCWQRRQPDRRLERAGIPGAYRHCDLDSFEVHHPSHERALARAREFVDTYPLTGPTGLLFHGPAGSGKTHLMAAIVSALVLGKGAQALFLDFRQLLKTIQESYNPVSGTSEKEVLSRVLETKLLALDDLGAEKPSPWVRETVAYVINERYSRGLPLLITTNLQFRVSSPEASASDIARRHGTVPERVHELLEDRVGVPTLSRLSEMCRAIDLTGAPDYRRTFKIFGAERFGLG